MHEMNDAETAIHLRAWADADDEYYHQHSPFAWPTDACGYTQHVRFVKYRNTQWSSASESGISFSDFIRGYADKLERGEITDGKEEQ